MLQGKVTGSLKVIKFIVCLLVAAQFPENCVCLLGFCCCGLFLCLFVCDYVVVKVLSLVYSLVCCLFVCLQVFQA